MFKIVKILFMIAETPVHVGGESALGIIDQPIQREGYTDFPKIEASAIKGCIKSAFLFEAKRSNNIERENQIYLVFGPEEGQEFHSSAIVFTDARLLLFPVKSLKGIFAWITCPTALERFRRDLELLKMTGKNVQVESDVFNKIQERSVPEESDVVIEQNKNNSNRKIHIVLEEFTFEVKKEESTSKIANWLADTIFPQDNSYNFWREKLKKHLVILNDDDFKHFIKNSTEIITRIKIDDETGTVQEGALWTEEYLPQDTILYSIVMFSDLRVEKSKQIEGLKQASDIAKFFENGLPKIIQIGGNQTIGKGFVRLNLSDLSKEG